MNERREYVVYRHGWNAANQSSMSGCPHKMKVARVQAFSWDHAKELAAQRVTVYNNQYLSAELASEVDAEEAELDQYVDTEVS
jgi:hypothetical protein